MVMSGTNVRGFFCPRVPPLHTQLPLGSLSCVQGLHVASRDSVFGFINTDNFDGTVLRVSTHAIIPAFLGTVDLLCDLRAFD